MVSLLVAVLVAANVAGFRISRGADVVSDPPARPELFDWTNLPPIPDEHGFAGAVAGIANDSLVVAGGANFPAGPPWEGGVKKWYDSVFVLKKPDATWQRRGTLPRPLGYAVSLTTAEGIACLGGNDQSRHYAECFTLRLVDDQVEIAPLPALPRPCANACGALLGRTIYIAGGIEKPDSVSALRTFWLLDLDHTQRGWQELEPCPGPPRMLATAGVQGGAFYVFAGASLSVGAVGRPQRTWLADCYCYRPGKGWKRCADLPTPLAAAPSPAPAMGQAHLLLLGGDDGRQAAADPTTHTGFSRRTLAYHTLTDTWADAAELPFGLVTTPAVTWGQDVIIPGGERRPGVRSTEVWRGVIAPSRVRFGWLNYSAIVGYLVGMFAIGAACASRNRSTEDYFRAGGRIPWWAAGISIYATMLSSLTFMAIPAKAFATDWTYVWANLPILLLAPLITRVYLPFFRRLNVTSAYEYLEQRFHVAIRIYASLAFVLFQIGRQAIVLLLPALALSTICDLDVTVCIVTMGLLCVVYTVMGGMEAVVWTDVAQTIVLLGAAIVSLALICSDVAGGPAAVARQAYDAGKLHLANWTWDPRTAANAFWVILVGNLFITLVPYTSDQAVVQRYLTTKDVAAARKGIWANALLAIPSTLLFFAIGAALYVYYSQAPQLLDPRQPTDSIFPVYITQRMPAGVAGLVIAGIFAAAQSTVSGSLNSVVTAMINDFYIRFGGERDERAMLRTARLWTALVGCGTIVAALVIARASIASLWDAYFNLVGLTASGLAALFALGMFTARANSLGATVGVVASILTLGIVERFTDIHFLLYSLIGFVSCFAVGLLTSCLCPNRI